MKTLARVLLLSLGTLCASAIPAEQKAPLETMISSLQQVGVVQCVTLRERLQQAKDNGTFREEMQGLYDNVCHCMPDQLQALRASLVPAVLESPVSESEFKELLLDRVIGKCSAQILQDTYRGERCPKLAGEHRPHPEQYCKCMAGKLAALPDRTLAEIGLANSDYVPLAAEAKRSGGSAPEMPPVLKRFMDIDRACTTP